MAVESIARDEYTPTSDVWAWGVTVWEVIINQLIRRSHPDP
jgi:hypothetical protein